MRRQKESRRIVLMVTGLAAVLVLGASSAAVAVDAYFHQSGGTESYSSEGWVTADWVPVCVENAGLFDLHDSYLEAYAETQDLGDIGTAATPAGQGVVTAMGGPDGGSYLKLESDQIYANGTQHARGPQGVLANGEGSAGPPFVHLIDSTIWCDQYSGRGLCTEVGAEIDATRCTITTNGSNDAGAVASAYDAGGTMDIDTCRVETWGGPGSPAFYSTGSFYVVDTQAFSHASDGAWLDGGGSLQWNDQQYYNLVMYNSSLYADKGNGVSFAKGPSSMVKNDNQSGLWMTACYLESAGPLFYAPNSKALITLDHTDTYSHSGVALTTKYNGQGIGGGQPSDANSPGGRESTVDVYCDASTLKGDVITDVDEVSGKDSVVNLTLWDWASLTGAINKADQGEVNLALAHESNWEVTDTSYLSQLTLPSITSNNSWGNGLYYLLFGPDLSMIHSHGHTVYYDPLKNSYLEYGTYKLPQGGWLVPEKQSIHIGMRPGVQ